MKCFKRYRISGIGIVLLTAIVALGQARGTGAASSSQGKREPRNASFSLNRFGIRVSTAGSFSSTSAPTPTVRTSAVPTFTATASVGPNLPVLGSGIVGHITKWTGLTSTNSYVGDSSIIEDKNGLVGIGTLAPSSKLTVMGLIETKGAAGGLKFPDGTVQTTAGLSSVVHDQTLHGSGAAASPLGIADGGVGTTQLADGAVTGAKIAPASVVKSLNGLTDNITLAAGANITLTPVGNTLTIASAIADPDQSAFQHAIEIHVPNEQDDFIRTEVLQVPSGKRLVIEYLSVSVQGSGECQPMTIETTVAGVTTQHWFQLPVETNGFLQALDKQVRIYSDGDVKFTIINRSGDLKAFRITVSGHLTDLP